MKLIVGLGNPGEKYTKTRHNVGFLVLDKIANNQKLIAFRMENQYKAEITQTGGVGEGRITFAKPQTFMNNSGEAVLKLLNYYKIGTDDLVVVCDDLDLPIGIIRIRLKGSSGGHKGLQSIMEQIGTDEFARIRVGIGSNREINIPSEAYVLQKFSEDEMKTINKSIDKTAEIVIDYINKGEFKEETTKIEARS